jgi:hypothetical protein
MQPRSSCFYLNALFFRRGDIYGREAETLVELLDREFEHLAARTSLPSLAEQDNYNNAASFNAMLEENNALQQQTMMGNMEMQKAQAYWNPLESMSKKGATS